MANMYTLSHCDNNNSYVVSIILIGEKHCILGKNEIVPKQPTAN